MKPIFHRLPRSLRRRIGAASLWFKRLPLPFYYCPVCDCKVAGMLPLGNHFIEPRKKFGNPYSLDDTETLNYRNYHCPKCDAADRDRLYALYFKERLGDGNVRFLDIAPSAPLSKFLAKFPKLRRRTADLFRTDVDDVADITNMPVYPNERFDVFICSHVLEHVNDDRAAMRELYRILAPGGWGIAMVPINLVADFDEDITVTDEGERWRRFGQGDHVRLYTKKVYLERLCEAGFRVLELGIDHFGAGIFSRCAITPSSVLYVVEKPA